MRNPCLSSSDKDACPAIVAGDLVAECDAVEGSSRGKREPHLAIGTPTPTPSDKLRLGFAGYVLGEQSRSRPSSGALLLFGEPPKRVKLEPLYPAVEKAVKQLRILASDLPVDPPPLNIGGHCQTCEFRDHCMAEAERTDSLFLLEKMTPKLVAKYHKKGIFTLTQLSYVYRPRRRKKATGKIATPFNVELQALAIRTKKIYLHEPPSLQPHPVELFLGIEGIPDEGFNYLIGIVVKNGDTAETHSFWADDPQEERRIFEECLTLASQYPDAPIYHYGAYERRAFERAEKRHSLDCQAFLRRLVNINGLVYGKVYFPTRSNRLKDLGAAVGATWPTPNPSGLQSVAWRYCWENTHDEAFRTKLLAYNEADCNALLLLTKELQGLSTTADSRMDVDFTNKPKQFATATGEIIHRSFDGILKSAHERYQGRKLHLKGRKSIRTDSEQDRKLQVRPRKQQRRPVPYKPARVIRVPRKRRCPYHVNRDLVASPDTASLSLIELAFTKSGCQKRVIQYIGARAYCPLCKLTYVPPAIRRLRNRTYGHAFLAWAAYQRVAMRLPYDSISELYQVMFHEHVNPSSITVFMRQFAEKYSATEERLARVILTGQLVHVDETKIKVGGISKYVWGLTDGKHAIFRLTDTRETNFLHKLLDGYDGVLISDFYGGYDSFACRQQKCLVHLIRDLNNDLWKNPFLAEYELFVARIRDLLFPIFEDVERYGLKKRHLQKHIRSVDRFYRQSIDGVAWESDLVRTYQKRFIRYRESLFLFLSDDGIPWNNNMGERVLRHLAVQRKISNTFFGQGAADYLTLLGIAQSCRLQEKSFLRFLLSEGSDVDAFKDPKRRRS